MVSLGSQARVLFHLSQNAMMKLFIIKLYISDTIKFCFVFGVSMKLRNLIVQLHAQILHIYFNHLLFNIQQYHISESGLRFCILYHPITIYTANNHGNEASKSLTRNDKLFSIRRIKYIINIRSTIIENLCIHAYK